MCYNYYSGDVMKGYIKIATYNDNKYGLISEFFSESGEIVFAYTRAFNDKYTYMLVDKVINLELIDKYLDKYE